MKKNRYIKKIIQANFIFLLVVPLYSAAFLRRGTQRLGHLIGRQTTQHIERRSYNDYLENWNEPFSWLKKSLKPHPKHRLRLEAPDPTSATRIKKTLPRMEPPRFKTPPRYGIRQADSPAYPEYFMQFRKKPKIAGWGIKSFKPVPTQPGQSIWGFGQQAQRFVTKTAIPEARQFITKIPQYTRNWWQKTVIPRAQQFGQYFKDFPLTPVEAKAARSQYRAIIRKIGIPKKQEAILLPYLEKMIAKHIPLQTQQKIIGGLIGAFFGTALIKGHKQIADSFMEAVNKYLGDDQPEEFDPDNEYQQIYDSPPTDEHVSQVIYDEEDFEQ